ncbi:hypothetical protein DYB37_013444 [Aphanomyces astaci]|uniref:SF4 helicase domain-containing protein n=1 Tax=Aphanomyces astaci TaxID=112090 RepID=A0A3R7BZP6_APHAT|nr:hypothetical protein DYB37_013444 [Aphanomyces astaci]
MLTQMAGRSLALNLDLFERTADEFEALPMYFLRFFGSSDVDEVLDAMEYAVYAYDVQHVILDNVQFMMSGQGRGYDKFERQDAALDKFRKFATAKNVHVTLVIHPRKEQDDADLTLSSVFGTAKATQEADNVLILQRSRGDVKLDVRKNRFDGSLGSIALQFDKEAACMREMFPTAMDESLPSRDLELQMEREARQRYEASAATDSSSRVPGINPAPSNVQGPSCDGGKHHATDPSNGAPVNGQVNGVNGRRVINGHHSPEPFSLFTPIITR